MISKATISFIQSLKQKKYRQKYNKFLLEGEKIVIEALKEGHIEFDSVYCLPEKEHLLEDIKIKYNIIDNKALAKISSLKTAPGILAVANTPELLSIEELELKGIVLYLDGIKDPGNMGTIIRTANWFGIETIIASEESVEFYNPKVIQASMGSFSQINLVNMNFARLDHNLPVYASALDGKSIHTCPRPDDLMLIIGSESHGVSQEIFDKCSEKITIPRHPNSSAESLNAGIATAILLSHLTN